MNFFCIVPILKYEIETILKIHILINKKIKIIKTYIVPHLNHELLFWYITIYKHHFCIDIILGKM